MGAIVVYVLVGVECGVGVVDGGVWFILSSVVLLNTHKHKTKQMSADLINRLII